MHSKVKILNAICNCNPLIIAIVHQLWPIMTMTYTSYLNIQEHGSDKIYLKSNIIVYEASLG